MTDLEHSPTEEKFAETGVKPDFAQYVQQQLGEIKQDVISRLSQISTHFPLSNEDVLYIKDTLKTEFANVLEEVTQTSKEIKQDLTEISLKHKEHLSETLKRSKDQAFEAFSKINLSQIKENKSETAE